MTLPLERVAIQPTGRTTQNPFKEALAAAQSDVLPSSEREQARMTPGSPYWWIDRLILKLLDRQARFTKLEDYALGNHPLPNLDLRFKKALDDLQEKALTNYCDLVIKATVQRMRVRGFKFENGEDDGNQNGLGGTGSYAPNRADRRAATSNRGSGNVRNPNRSGSGSDGRQGVRQSDRQGQRSSGSQQDNPSGRTPPNDRNTTDEDNRRRASGNFPKPSDGEYPNKLTPPIDVPEAAVVDSADKDARRYWDANDMDVKSKLNLTVAATLGVCYGLVTEKQEGDPCPRITIEDPRCAVIEPDPLRYGEGIAGLRMWQDDILGYVVATLFLPEYTYVFVGPAWRDRSPNEVASLTREWVSNPRTVGFELATPEQCAALGLSSPIAPNTLSINGRKRIPLVEGVWQPVFGPLGQAEHEGILHVQDRINHTVLDRLIITKSQAYRQRWVSGASPAKGKKGQKAPAWDPGADMIWVTDNENAKFGDFEQADITQVLEAISEDANTIATLTQTPAGYFANRMVNVSGDTLAQDQAGLVMKVKDRWVPMGWFYERLVKYCFAYDGDDTRASSTEATTLWDAPEVHSLSEKADAMAKLAPVMGIQLAMETIGGYTPEEINTARQEMERQKAQEFQQQQMMVDRQAAHGVAQQDQSAAHAVNQSNVDGKNRPPPATQKQGGNSNKKTSGR